MTPHRLEDLLRDAAAPSPDRAAVHAGDRVVSYGELVESSRALASTLRDHGAGDRARVGVMLGNEPEAIVAWFGVFEADAVVVLLNPRLTDAELVRISGAAGVTAIVVGPDDRARCRDGRPARRRSHMARVVRDGDAGAWHGDDDTDLAIVQLTSGTTGKPRPVPQTHSRMLDLMGRVVSTVGGRDAGAREDPMPNLIPVSLARRRDLQRALRVPGRGSGRAHGCVRA